MLPTFEHTEQRTLRRAGAFGPSLVGMLLRYSHGGSVAPLSHVDDVVRGVR